MKMAAVSSEYARTHWGELLERARFGAETVVIAAHGKPVTAVMSVLEWRTLARAHDVDPDQLTRRLSRAARTDMRGVLNDARAGRATLVTFRDKEDVAVFAPTKYLDEDEIDAAVAAADLS